MTVLAVNAGSSTVKFALYPVQGTTPNGATLLGSLEGLEPGGQLSLSWRRAGQASQVQPIAVTQPDPFADALQALQTLLQQEAAGRDLQAVAHRVVHGGDTFRKAVVVDDAVLQTLSGLSSLAPLHQPHNVQGIAAFMRAFPEVVQVACFDTAFHADLPPEEYLFALPLQFRDQGVRRYGFHGLSYQYIRDQLQQMSARSQGRVVMAHLGNGASLCATLGGKSQATTMGFSALDGLMMGTRSGSIDAGVLLHLLEQGWDHDRLQDLLYRQSGLLGVSGLSADMRQLRASALPAAQLAIRLFTHRVIREMGAMAGSLGGMDVLAFTGGIGEHDSALRADVCAQLAFLGLELDPQKNLAAHGDEAMALHTPDSTIEVWVIPTDEGRVAAQEAIGLLRTLKN